MRPNTIPSGIFSTKRSRPVSTSILTRMLVPKPKKAFQSPGVHKVGLKLVVVALLIDGSPIMSSVASRRLFARARERGERVLGIRNPAEDAALGLDHLQAHLVEFGKIGGAAIGQHDAAIAAVIGLAHGGVDADLGGHAAYQEILDAVFPQDIVEFGGVERALAGLVDDDLAVERIQRGNDVVAGF